MRDARTVKINGSVFGAYVDRAQLRNTMVECLPDSCNISYGKAFASYCEDDSGVKVFFEDGSIAEGDILVGADGARSRVRAQRCKELIPSILPIWTDMGLIVMDEAVTEQLRGNFLFDESQGSMVRKSGSAGVSWLSLVHASSAGPRLLWTVSIPKAIALQHALSSDLPHAEMRERTAALARDLICPEAAAIVALTPDAGVFGGYDFTSVDPGTVRANPLAAAAGSRVTLIGDAAHKTTTQAGLGATAALCDAVGLADEIARAAAAAVPPDLAETLRAHERAMAARASAMVAKSVGNTARIHEAHPARVAVIIAVLSAAGHAVALWDWARGPWLV